MLKSKTIVHKDGTLSAFRLENLSPFLSEEKLIANMPNWGWRGIVLTNDRGFIGQNVDLKVDLSVNLETFYNLVEHADELNKIIF